MKILMYCLNYAPELTGIGKYTSEQAEWLVARGHEVRVITAPPYYPEWKVAEGYSASSYAREIHNGVTVLRAPLWIPHRPSGLKRLVHLASFAASTVPLLFWQARWKPDAIFVVEPPLFCSPATLLFGKLFGSKTWLHIQDFEVDAAFALGLLKSKLARRLVERLERWLLRKFDRVSTISQAMKRLAQAKGVEASRLVHFPNWVDVASIHPRVQGESIREALGIPKEAIVALYSGNMGRKQGLEMLAEAARILRHSERIYFIFCGHGPGKAELEKACEPLTRVSFLPLQPVERLPLLLASADIHLLPQRADAADLVMPSKLTGMLASGRAIVATAGDDTEVAHVVKGRGIVVAPGNSLALATAIQTLADDDALRIAYGAAARQYAETNLGLDSLLARFEESLMAAIHESALGNRPAEGRP
ncbi:glycosyltransferase WbuB [Cupriavidus necator]|uniref:glycosyltransferase WbuB n=1 Tax=Cupriavidus necator TaxID=106590 RepID=UPI002786E665|nr:glycosyltransferase WbuB [Cupriavidus necator]MDQ0139605.1 colanic acid biosynthesis glycosyl transferase WcaI [Cupriavidus necator]